MTPKIPAGGNALCSAVVLGGVPPVAMHVCALCSLCVTAACTLKLKQDTAPVSAGGKYSEKNVTDLKSPMIAAEQHDKRQHRMARTEQTHT